MKNQNRVVVTGIGILCSLGQGKDEVVKNLLSNITKISKVKRFDTTVFLTDIGAEIPNVDFDQMFNETDRDKMDITTQYAITAVKEALADSGASVDDEEIGLILGTCNGGICSIENSNSVDTIELESLKKYPFYEITRSTAAYTGLRGPINTINTACAASGNAIAYAYDLIKNGYINTMVAGGADALSKAVYAGFNSLNALNSEPCSPYSVETGLTLGEGAAFVVLESLECARMRGAKIYAEICGYGLTNDAYHITAPEPSGMGICRAVEMAVMNAGIEKSEISYVNTHGTGTAANDAAELKGLKKCFGENFDKMLISSSKAYFGHNLGAAAAIEYTSTLLAMQSGYLPATMNFAEPREDCDFENILTNEIKQTEISEYFLCNNSAFGGHNCSIISKTSVSMDSEEYSVIDEETPAYIVGKGSIVGGGISIGSTLELLESDPEVLKERFSLKSYDKNLFGRRMNELTQMSIGVVDMALEDAGFDKASNGEACGLCYGTSKGSLDSATKYLDNIYANGFERASSIHFPDMVLNSTAGKVAKAHGVKGYATSTSSGGNEGLISLFNAYQKVGEGVADYCLAVSGDEKSDFSLRVSEAQNVSIPAEKYVEGSTSLLIASENVVNASSMKVYGKIDGFAFGRELDKVLEALMKRSGLMVGGIDFALYSIPAVKPSPAVEDELWKKLSVETISRGFDGIIGYGESISGMNQVSFALDALKDEKVYKKYLDGKTVVKKKAVVVTCSLSGDYAAVVINANV